MSEMVERVARSLAHAVGAKMCGPTNCVATRELGWKPDGAHLDEYADRHWREHLHAASFAIEAMREPTVEMIDAACVAQIDLYPAFEGQKPHPTAGEVIGTCHRAMIDAALGK